MLYATLRKWRVSVLVIFVVILLGCALAASRMSPDSSVAPFFPDSDGHSARLARLLGQSPLSGLIFVELTADDEELLHESASRLLRAIPADLAHPVAFSPRDIAPETVLALLPSFFDAEMAHELSRLDERGMIALLEEDKAVLASLAGSPALPWVQKDPLQLRRLLMDRLPKADIPITLSPDLPWLFNDDGRHALLLLRSADSTFATSTATRLLATLLELQQTLPHGVSLQFSGGPLHTAANARTIEADVNRIAVFSLVGIAVIYLLMVRSLAVIWLVLIPAAATLTACGVTSLFWPAVSTLALGFGVSLMGLAEDYAAHMAFGLSSGHGAAKIHAILTRPLVMSCLLNISGFFCLLFSGIPAVRQLALFSMLSLGTGCLMALLILPLLPWSGRQQGAGRYCAPRPPHVPSARRALGCALLLCLGIALLLPLSRFDFSPRSLGGRTYALAEAAERMRSRWSLAANTPLVIQGKDAETSLEDARAVAHILRTEAALKLTSPTDYLPPLAEREANCARWQVWQERDSAAFLARLDRAAARTGFSPAAFAAFRDALLAPARPVTPLSVRSRLGDMASLSFFRIGEDHYTVLSLKDLPDGFSLEQYLDPARRERAYLLDPSIMEREISDLFRAETPLILLSMLFCLAVLCLSQRRGLRILIMALSPLASLLAVLAIFLLLDKALTLAACIAVPIVLGLAVDHGIMVTHALESGRELGIRKAVSLSTLTAFLSMGLLAFADHPALQSMGLVTFTGLAVELFCSLFFIPLLYRPER